MKPKRIIEVDLRQAESRFIAWDGPVSKMQAMYEKDEDIHKYVATHIFRKPMNEITDLERQLGKKSGHGANYKMGPATFAASCLRDMDLVISEQRAAGILAAYFRSWDGELERWQQRQVDFVRQHRFLETPFGRKRYFYDRMSPALEREICAFKPQATIPDVINCLIRKLFYDRPAVSLKLLMQGHDSVQFECDPEDELACVESCKDQDSWNPTMQLAGGPLRIPIEIKAGWNFKDKEVIFVG